MNREPDEPDPLSPGEQELLAAFKDSEQMPEEGQRRVWGVVAGAGAGGMGAAASATGAVTPWIIAAGTVLVGAALGIAVVARQPVEPSPAGSRTAQADAPAHADAAVPTPGTDHEVAEPPVSPSLPVQVVDEPTDSSAPPQARPRGPAGPKKKSDRAPSKAAPVDPMMTASNDLAEEAAILARARRALAAGNAKQALEVLDEHERSHRRGVLAPERQALEVIALCADDRIKAGLEKRAVFSAAHPGHALEARVRKACADAE